MRLIPLTPRLHARLAPMTDEQARHNRNQVVIELDIAKTNLDRYIKQAQLMGDRIEEFGSWVRECLNTDGNGIRRILRYEAADIEAQFDYNKAVECVTQCRYWSDRVKELEVRL